MPISSIGLGWEAANPGWNTNLKFNDSSGGWHNAIISEWHDPYADAALIWADGPLGYGSTPAYFRKAFTLTEKPVYAVLRLGVDDDAQVYINGHLVIDDQDGWSSGFTIDVSQFVKTGENVIAIKAHDSFGGNEWLTARLEVGNNTAQSAQSAQSVMIGNHTDRNFVIRQSETWEFFFPATFNYFTNVWDGNPPIVLAVWHIHLLGGQARQPAQRHHQHQKCHLLPIIGR